MVRSKDNAFLEFPGNPESTTVTESRSRLNANEKDGHKTRTEDYITCCRSVPLFFYLDFNFSRHILHQNC